MKRRPYIGMTGFMNPEEVAAISRESFYSSESLGPLMMFGFLMSEKTLNGLPNKYPFKYPKRESLANLFARHPLGMNIIHYSSDNPRGLLLQLFSMVGLYWSGNCLKGDLDGFQLNMAWPDPRTIEEFRNQTNERKHFTIILQIGGKALQEVDNSPKNLAARLKDYEDIVDYLLIDQSRGEGRLPNPTETLNYLRAIRDSGISEKINPGFAGGLNARTIPIFKSIIREIPGVSTDAESAFFDYDGKFSIKEVALYFLKTLQAHGYTEK